MLLREMLVSLRGGEGGGEMLGLSWLSQPKLFLQTKDESGSVAAQISTGLPSQFPVLLAGGMTALCSLCRLNS